MRGLWRFAWAWCLGAVLASSAFAQAGQGPISGGGGGGGGGGGEATSVQGSATLPATCTEKDLYQDTNSGGSEVYVCTETNVWTKFLNATGTEFAPSISSGSGETWSMFVDTSSDGSVDASMNCDASTVCTQTIRADNSADAGFARFQVDGQPAGVSSIFFHAVPASGTVADSGSFHLELNQSSFDAAGGLDEMQIRSGVIDFLGSSFTFEGATADGFEGNFVFEDPTADWTLAFAAGGTMSLGAFGTAATPGYGFSGASGVGIYAFNSSVLGFSANGFFALGSAGSFYLNNHIGLDNAGEVFWDNSTTSYAGGVDLSITRKSAGVLKVTDGSTGIRGMVGGGAAVASATAMPLPTGGVFHVTGTTQIDSVTSTNFQAGVCITLIFDGILTISDANNLKLAGAFVTSADDTLGLCFDGSSWFETSRSVN